MKRVIILTPGNITTRQFRNVMTQKETSRFMGYLNDDSFTIYGIVDEAAPHCWFVTYNSPEDDLLITACGWVANKPITRDDITLVADLAGKQTAYGLTNRKFEARLFKALDFQPHERTYEFETKNFSLLNLRPEIQLLDRTEISPTIRLQIEELLYKESVQPEAFFSFINDVRFRTAAFIVNGEVRGVCQIHIDNRANPYIRLLITANEYRRRGVATLLICFMGNHLSLTHPKFYISVPESSRRAVKLVAGRLCKVYKLGKLIAKTVSSEMEVATLTWYKKRLREKDSFGNITSDEEGEADYEDEEELVA